MNVFRAHVIGSMLALSFLAACESGIPWSYRGRYAVDFEESSFSPCGKPERWWVEMSARSPALDSALRAASQRASRLEPSRITPPPPGAPPDLGVSFNSRIELYLEVRGRLSPRGRYGHLSGYDRQLRIKNVRSVGPWDEVMCE